MSVKVTNQNTPTATTDQLLIVEAFDGTPTPNGRLKQGVYYSFQNVWRNFTEKLGLDKLFVPLIRTITINGTTKTLEQNIDFTVSGTSVKWGDITGTLSDQTDLKSALDAKQDALGFTPEDVANKSTSIPTDQASNTKYPSVKSVFDWVTLQLNSLYAPRILYADNNTYLITGGTGEVIGVSRLIPANTLSSDKSLEVRCRVLRVSGTAGVITPRIRFSTSATPSPVNSATQIANGVQMATGNFWQQMKRTFARKTSTSLEVFNATIQLADDDVQTTVAASTVTFDTTVDQWLHFTIQNSNAADTSAISHISIILV